MALRGIKVIELAGLAPAPFCGMILSDFGASVTRIDKTNSLLDIDRLSRGKRSVTLDLRSPEGPKIFKKICSTADVLIEPFRAGVMEKLGLGPSDIAKVNPSLIYARLTGFGQEGPFASMAGHDINYIGLSGILSTFGRSSENPHPPINLMGDFAGGGLLCALGICMALIERNKSRKGQVIDANMVEGSAYIGSWLWKTQDINVPLPLWGQPRGKNMLDGGSHFYQVYRTSDDKFMSVGAIEPQFYSELLKGLGLDEIKYPQWSNWDKHKESFVTIFASKTQAEWCQIFDKKNACVTPVLDLNEAPLHYHNAARQSFIKSGNNYYPRPAPQLSRTQAEVSLDNPRIGEHTVEVLREAGCTADEIQELHKKGVVEITDLNSKL